MKRILTAVLAATFILWAGGSFAASNVGVKSDPPLVTGGGGPDAYGYTWIDNDSAGGPDYQWVDITAKPGAVEITSMMGDDNVVGPFDVGFVFNYYWYTVDHCYIGSNGYISFTDNDNYSHPFSPLPSESRPNNLLCPIAGDIDYSRGDGELWYWSDGQDSFVVSWINVPEFFADPSIVDSTHTFQLILTRPDSTIHFMYGEQHGSYNSSGVAYVIGIEDVSGTVGLEYCYNGMPFGNVFHDSLAIRFHAEPDPTFEFYDLGVLNAMSVGSRAEVYYSGDEVTLKAEYKNNGTHPQTDIETRVIVRDPEGTELMRDTVIIASLDAQESVWLEYSRKLTTTITGEYSIEFRLYVVDEVANNNRKIFELRVLEFNGLGTDAVFLWDDTTLETCRGWNGDYSGYANEFEVRGPYAFLIKEVHVPIQGASGGSGGNLIAQIVEQDEFGNPGNIIAERIVYIPWSEFFQWKIIDFTSEDIIVNPNERIWAVGIHETQSTFYFCSDETYTSPRSNRGFEHTGMLAPDRHRETSDEALRLLVEWREFVGVEDEDYAGSRLPDKYTLAQNYPNPFNAKTSITYQVPKASDVRLEVYNLAGQKVATLVNGIQTAGRHVVTWDGSEAASGIYFYKLSAGDHTSMKRMALLK